MGCNRCGCEHSILSPLGVCCGDDEIGCLHRHNEQLADHIAASERAREEAETTLRCWREAFGTSQLTHAKARLEAAESKAARAEEAEAREANANAKLAAVGESIGEAAAMAANTGPLALKFALETIRDRILASDPEVIAVVEECYIENVRANMATGGGRIIIRADRGIDYSTPVGGPVRAYIVTRNNNAGGGE